MLYSIKRKIRKMVPENFVLFIHKIRAIYANLINGFPSKGMKVIAVSGTKGKTTTANLITSILQDSGHKVAMLSTANFQIDNEKWLNDVKLTTPSASYVQKFLKKAKNAGCDYAVLEASSHGLVQNRYWGVDFETAIITNLGSDHLDYHKTFDNYKNSHLKLLNKKLKNLIVNYDDINTHDFLKQEGDFKKIVFTIKNDFKESGLSEIKVEHLESSDIGSEFKVLIDSKEYDFFTPLRGDFNVYNALGALAVCHYSGISLDSISRSISGLKSVPGRLEKIEEGQNFEVVVDYAHSPESLENVYSAVKNGVKGDLIAVLGGTGDRDKTYRAKGGEIADRYADIIFVTNEDPYSEEIEDIIDQVMSGIKNKKIDDNLFRVSDRKEAIGKAISIAKEGDMVMITGKGCEQFMIIKDKKIPWDDRKIARDFLEDLKNKD